MEPTNPRQPPRFVPTLTETLSTRAPSPGAAAAREPAAHSSGATASIDAQRIAQAVLREMGPELDKRITEAIARVLHEQMLGLNGRVQRAVSEVVHEAVTQAIARRGGG